MENLESRCSSSKSFVAKDVEYHEVPRGEDQDNVALDDKIPSNARSVADVCLSCAYAFGENL